MPFELFCFLCETSVCLISRLLSNALQLRVGRHTERVLALCCSATSQKGIFRRTVQISAFLRQPKRDSALPLKHRKGNKYISLQKRCYHFSTSFESVFAHFAASARKLTKLEQTRHSPRSPQQRRQTKQTLIGTCSFNSTPVNCRSATLDKSEAQVATSLLSTSAHLEDLCL